MLDIVAYPHKSLTQKAERVDRIDGNIRALCRDMVRTLSRAQGIGLAAPQVGIGKRLFIVKLPDERARIFINPVIVEFSDEVCPYEEGCLSIQGIYVNVSRPKYVKTTFQTKDGKQKTIDADGMLARVIQHEYDHLDGVLFWDRVGKALRDTMMREYASIQRQADI